jgi:hypothetical protein
MVMHDYPDCWGNPYDETDWDQVQSEMAQEEAAADAEAWEIAIEEQNRHNDILHEQDEIIARQARDEYELNQDAIRDGLRRDEINLRWQQLRTSLGLAPDRPSTEQMEAWRNRRQRMAEADSRFLERERERQVTTTGFSMMDPEALFVDEWLNNEIRR